MFAFDLKSNISVSQVFWKSYLCIKILYIWKSSVANNVEKEQNHAQKNCTHNRD